MSKTLFEAIAQVSRIIKELHKLETERSFDTSSKFKIERATQALDELKTGLQKELSGD